MIPLNSSGRLMFGFIGGALVAGTLAFTGTAASAVPATPGAKVLLLNDPSYVDTVNLDDYRIEVEEGSAGREAPNMILALQADGHHVTTLLGTNAVTISSALAGRDTFVIPELEEGNWVGNLDDAAKAAVTGWVRAGGTLVIAADYGGDALNELFGYSLEGTSGVSWENTSSAGSPFFGGPATLPELSATEAFPLSSLPAGAVAQYVDDTSAVVVSFPQSKGTVISLGWDWYDAAPARVGGADGGWNDVLDVAVRTGIDAPAKVLAPSNVFKLPAKGKVNRKNATVSLSLKLPGAGQVKVVSARKGVLKSVSKSVGTKGTTKVTLKPSKKTMKQLRKQLKSKKVATKKVKVKVTYTPKGGKARTVTKTYTLKLKKR